MIGKYFKKCFISSEIGYNKPEFEFYSYIEQELNLKPSEILFIDDCRENIESADQKGWNTYLYKQDLNQLKQYLKKLNLHFQ